MPFGWRQKPQRRFNLMKPEHVLRVAVAVTMLHLVATGLGFATARTAGVLSGVINVGLFLVGVVLYVASFLLTAGRSRTEDIWFGGAFLLTGGVVPATHRKLLLGCVAAQIVTGLIGASLRPFTVLAFAVLPPLLGLAIVAFYGARFARFDTKPSS